MRPLAVFHDVKLPRDIELAETPKRIRVPLASVCAVTHGLAVEDLLFGLALAPSGAPWVSERDPEHARIWQLLQEPCARSDDLRRAAAALRDLDGSRTSKRLYYGRLLQCRAGFEDDGARSPERLAHEVREGYLKLYPQDRSRVSDVPDASIFAAILACGRPVRRGRGSKTWPALAAAVPKHLRVAPDVFGKEMRDKWGELGDVAREWGVLELAVVMSRSDMGADTARP